MASIQQSFNQMLYTGTIAAGLYAHSPKGQTQAEIKKNTQALKTSEQASKMREQEIVAAMKAQNQFSKEEIETMQKAFESDRAKEEVKYRKELASLQPENLEAFRSLGSAIERQRNIKKELEERKKILNKKEVANNG